MSASDGTGPTIPDLLAAVLVKTFYGHTIGEILTLAVALERAVDVTLAQAMSGRGSTPDGIVEEVLGYVPREQKLNVLRTILKTASIENADAMADRIRSLYKLRDQFAHSALRSAALAEDGWQLTSRRRGVEKAVALHPIDVEMTLKEGNEALESLMMQFRLHDDDVG